MQTLIALCIFSIAMAALESAVVVYLRALYYPDGFSVAFRLIDEEIVFIEILRELATLAMLLAVAWLAGVHRKERMAYFLIAFAVWDIFYYLWLKVFIDWPASFLEWDILFLIPFTWLGPVLAPIVCSATMIVLAVALLSDEKPVSWSVWIFLIAGSAIILYTFLDDYGTLIISNGFLGDYANILTNEQFLSVATAYTPRPYQWSLFWLGEALLLAGVVLQHPGSRRIRRLRPSRRKTEAAL